MEWAKESRNLSIFSDEPTTGLDSSTAFGLVSCLRRLAASSTGNTIIASIHTPNEETLALFDQMYIMARGGVCIFSGPPSTLPDRLRILELDADEDEDQSTGFSTSALATAIATQKRKATSTGLPPPPPIEVMLKVACAGYQAENVLKLATPVQAREREVIAQALPYLTRQPAGGIEQSYKGFSPSDLLTESLRLFRLTFFNARSQLLSTFLLFLFLFILLTSIFNHHKATANGCFSVVVPPPPVNESVFIPGVKEPPPVCQNIEQNLLTNELLSENIHFISYTVFILGMISLVSNVSLFGKYLKVLVSEHHNRKFYFWVLFLNHSLSLQTGTPWASSTAQQR